MDRLEIIYPSLPGGGGAGSLFLLSPSETPLAVIDTANLYQFMPTFFKNGPASPESWDERHMFWDEQPFFLENTWPFGTARGNTWDERRMSWDE